MNKIEVIISRLKECKDTFFAWRYLEELKKDRKITKREQILLWEIAKLSGIPTACPEWDEWNG